MKKVLSSLLSMVMLMCCLGFNSSIVASAGNYYNKTISVVSKNFERPTVLNKGQEFTLKGNIKADKKIDTITIFIEDLDQFKTDLTYSAKVNSNSVNLSKYAGKIKFSTLPSGVKCLKIRLKGFDGGTITLSRQFTVLGKAREPRHITKKCKIVVSNGDVNNLIDNSNDTFWKKGRMTIEFPKKLKVDGIAISWNNVRNDFIIKEYLNNELINEYNGSKEYFIHQYYPINEKTTKLEIILKNNDKSNKGMAGIRVYQKGKVGVSVEHWEKPKAKGCDLMVVSGHRDDELLFFGGTIPYYNNVKNKSVYTVYMSGNDRERIREALAGQWSMGVKTYPIFMGYDGGYHDGIKGTLKDWGGESACIAKLVEKIRCYQPEVIVTHDVNGEYGHPTHKTTAYLVSQAVTMAADKNKYPASYKKYGTWQVKKVYKHYTNKNPITMNWDKHYKKLDGKSPYQQALVAFDKHRSQHKNWSMNSPKVTKYPNNKYGLVYSKVGNDKKKNDFFEHIK